MGEVKEHRIGRLRRIGVAAALSCPPGEAREVWRQSFRAALCWSLAVKARSGEGRIPCLASQEGRTGGLRAVSLVVGGLPAAHAR